MYTPHPKQEKQSAAIFILWQSLVVLPYRSFFAKLATANNYRIALAAPARFRELAQQDVKCAPFSPPFREGDAKFPYFILKVFCAHVQAVWFFGLGKALRSFFARSESDHSRRIFVCVAEPYSITALLAWFSARWALGKEFSFICYGLQNIFKKLPLPLALIQSFIFKRCTSILVAGKEQELVLRQHGYTGQTIPFALWFDSERFFERTPTETSKVVIGYAGALTEAKGVLDFLECCERNVSSWSLSSSIRIAGAGLLQERVHEACQRLSELGLDARYVGALASEQMPEFFGEVDILVVPSRTRQNWKEQFGRVIIEANACGVVVLGSDSGEIPNVIKARDRIFNEGNISDMTNVIREWVEKLQNPELRKKVRSSEAGKAVQRYSDEVLAQQFAANLQEITVAS